MAIVRSGSEIRMSDGTIVADVLTSFSPIKEYKTQVVGRWKSGGGDSPSLTSFSTTTSPYGYYDRLKAANAAKQYRLGAEDALSRMRGATDVLTPLVSGVGIDGYLQDATANYGKINRFADEAAETARGITTDVENVRKSANDITNIAASLREYEPLLREMGETMFGEGGELVGSGNEYINTGLSLLGLDKSAGGLAGTYAQVLAALDPSLAVSMATNDTRSAFETQMAANERAMARRGVSAGSGQSAATMQQAGQALATALAAMKTKTRMSSNKDYFEAMRGAVADANALGSTGASIVTQGVNAQSAGAQAVKSAAGVLTDQGQLTASAANAYGTAGQLLGMQANALTSAGQLTTAAGNLALGAANAKVSEANAQINAANAIAGVEGTAMQYYSSMFNNFSTIAEGELFDVDFGFGFTLS